MNHLKPVGRRMFVNLLAFIAAGIWVLGFATVGRIVWDVLRGKGAPADRSDVWLLIGICFGVGVGMLIILGMLGYFAEPVTNSVYTAVQ